MASAGDILGDKGSKKRTYVYIGLSIVGVIIAYLTYKKLGTSSANSQLSSGGTVSGTAGLVPTYGQGSASATYGSSGGISGLSDALAQLQSQYQSSNQAQTSQLASFQKSLNGLTTNVGGLQSGLTGLQNNLSGLQTQVVQTNATVNVIGQQYTAETQNIGLLTKLNHLNTPTLGQLSGATSSAYGSSGSMFSQLPTSIGG